MIEGLVLHPIDRVDMGCGYRCLRLRNVLSNLLPRRGVLNHHGIVLLRTQWMSILQRQGPLVLAHDLELRLRILGSYTSGGTWSTCVDALALDGLPSDESRQFHGISSELLVEDPALINALKMLLYLLIELLLAHVDRGVLRVELVQDVRLSVPASRNVPDILVVVRVHHLIVLEAEGAVGFDAALLFFSRATVLASTRRLRACTISSTLALADRSRLVHNN